MTDEERARKFGTGPDGTRIITTCKGYAPPSAPRLLTLTDEERDSLDRLHSDGGDGSPEDTE